MKSAFPYYILRNNSEDVQWIVERDVYDNKENHIIPKIDPLHQFVLMERTQWEDNKNEYFCNAFSSNSHLELISKAEKKNKTVFNYTGTVAVIHYENKGGKYTADTFNTYCENSKSI